MLQEFRQPFPSKPGEGVSICFICEDALAIYHGAKARGLDAATPLVGNAI
jgi:lactoylglutathione lyase